MKDEVRDALNEQVNAEFYSAYLYLSMSAYFESESLPGFANWMRVQAQEELTHAMKIYDFVIERGGRAELMSIEEPSGDWDSPLDAFKTAYEHEKKVTNMINDLVDLAIEKGDHATRQMLQWFVGEQVEEEDSADEIVQRLKRVGDDGRGLLMLDRELGQRQFVDETKENEE